MTVQSANASTVWTSDLSGGVLERFSFGAGPDGIGGVAWLPDDRLVYGSTATGQVVLLMSARGGPARTLTQQADEAVSSFSVSPDGRVAVFDAVRDGARGIWRLELENGRRRRRRCSRDRTSSRCTRSSSRQPGRRLAAAHTGSREVVTRGRVTFSRAASSSR